MALQASGTPSASGQKEKHELNQLDKDVKIEINNPPPISSSETPVYV
jgi:hypothetical protein